MRLSSRHKGLAASGALLLIAVLCAGSVIRDHLRDRPFAPAGPRTIGITGSPLEMAIGTSTVRADSTRIDPGLDHVNVMEGVVVTMPGVTIEAQSGIMFPSEDCLLLEQAVLRADDLEGKIGTLVMRDKRIVFQDVRAWGSVAPLRVSRFEARRILLPETALEKRGVGLRGIADGISGGENDGDNGPGRTEFGFKELELVLTVLFQRAYISGGYINLPDGTAIRIRKGIYSSRHRKVYAEGVSVSAGGTELRAKKAEIRMKRGQLVLIPPIERIEAGGSRTVNRTLVVPLR